MMSPGARETLGFVLPLLPRGARVLEVGCGAGELAEALSERGVRVSALDASPKAVAAARARGVAARLGRFPDYRGGPFDAVLFTRSLHHIWPLDAAVDGAARLLRRGGLVICEDFDLRRVGAAEAEWLFARRGGGAQPMDGALAWWRHEHEHEPPLHRASGMARALGRRFRERGVERVPYLYRYVQDWRGATRAKRSLERERRALASRRLRAVGWRFVGHSA